MGQEVVRKRLLRYLTEKGVKQGFICKKIELPNSVLTGFKQGKKDLYLDTLDKLDDFLKKENF